MNYKIAILGNKDAVLGFKALGVETFGVDNLNEAEKIISIIYSAADYAIIFITEDWMSQLNEFMEKLERRALPAIVAIPSQQGTTGAGLRNLKKIVEQAVGSDILNIQ